MAKQKEFGKGLVTSKKRRGSKEDKVNTGGRRGRGVGENTMEREIEASDGLEMRHLGGEEEIQRINTRFRSEKETETRGYASWRRIPRQGRRNQRWEGGTFR